MKTPNIKTQRKGPVSPEPLRASPDEIAALKDAGIKLSRKERRAEKAQARKRSS